MVRLRNIKITIFPIATLSSCRCSQYKRFLNEQLSVESRMDQFEVEIQNLKAMFAEKNSQVSSYPRKFRYCNLKRNPNVGFAASKKKAFKDLNPLYYTAGSLAGKNYSLGGSGANMLCLSNDPEWNHFSDGGNVLNNHQDFGTSKLNKDIPCAVCKTPEKSSVLMIPGKTSCYGGRNKEFLVIWWHRLVKLVVRRPNIYA
ncbi:Hypothetical predicted protein [Mytilus galloprovincialis]|uniref:Uncharacterized protein n=1 Tax=Mytilus galloprovincialis TaxID=29158 RepID=A0A8B6BR10_MYTGA|nr:Hypothetical predicted protein [Mytilus galloprovincialis]